MVTASDVVDEPNDTARLTQMAEQAEEITSMTLADAGYFAGKHVGNCTIGDSKYAAARPTDHPSTGSYTMRRPTVTPAQIRRLHRNKERPEGEPHLSSGFWGNLSLSRFRNLYEE